MFLIFQFAFASCVSKSPVHLYLPIIHRRKSPKRCNTIDLKSIDFLISIERTWTCTSALRKWRTLPLNILWFRLTVRQKQWNLIYNCWLNFKYRYIHRTDSDLIFVFVHSPPDYAKVREEALKFWENGDSATSWLEILPEDMELTLPQNIEPLPVGGVQKRPPLVKSGTCWSRINEWLYNKHWKTKIDWNNTRTVSIWLRKKTSWNEQSRILLAVCDCLSTVN